MCFSGMERRNNVSEEHMYQRTIGVLASMIRSFLGTRLRTLAFLWRGAMEQSPTAGQEEMSEVQLSTTTAMIMLWGMDISTAHSDISII